MSTHENTFEEKEAWERAMKSGCRSCQVLRDRLEDLNKTVEGREEYAKKLEYEVDALRGELGKYDPTKKWTGASKQEDEYNAWMFKKIKKLGWEGWKD